MSRAISRLVSLLHPFLRTGRQRLFVFVFPLEQPRAGAQINSKASDSSVCFSDEQMYRAARLGAGRRGER